MGTLSSSIINYLYSKQDVLSGEQITMKKYGIGTGIFTLIFGTITYLSFFVFFTIRGGDVENLGEFFAFLALGLVFLLLSLIIGVISGGITLLFFIITIVRIIKAIKGPKVDKTQTYQSEPRL